MLVKFQTRGRWDDENPDIQSICTGVWVLGTQYLELVRGGQSCGLSQEAWGSGAHSGMAEQSRTAGHPTGAQRRGELIGMRKTPHIWCQKCCEYKAVIEPFKFIPAPGPGG